MKQRGWEQPDFVYVSGDAYVDHPSFGAALITRVLEAAGFKVAMLSQPDWHNTRDFIRFGRPRLGFLVSSGNIDSMVAHYTAAKKKRSEDAYTPGGKAGKRPDRSAGWRPPSGGLRITTIGTMRSAPPFCSTPARIC